MMMQSNPMIQPSKNYQRPKGRNSNKKIKRLPKKKRHSTPLKILQLKFRQKLNSSLIKRLNRKSPKNQKHKLKIPKRTKTKRLENPWTQLPFWPRKNSPNNKNSNRSKDKKSDYMSSNNKESGKNKKKKNERKKNKNKESVKKKKNVSK
jgi:hypothetical protein